MAPLAGLADWETTLGFAKALGCDFSYAHPLQVMDEIAALTPTFAGVSYAKLDEMGSVQWPCNAQAPEGTPIMHVDRFVRGKGRFMITEFVPTDERTTQRFPLILTTGRILSQYNVGVQTQRTMNNVWHGEDVLEIHPFDAENRGIREGDLVAIQSRSGEVALHAHISERMQPGVVYTTFHHAKSGANVITTDYSDWATNCPEYKVTAVQVQRTNRWSDWQEADRASADLLRMIERSADAAE
jgi:formate dehydrogenase major subunit